MWIWSYWSTAMMYADVHSRLELSFMSSSGMAQLRLTRTRWDVGDWRVRYEGISHNDTFEAVVVRILHGWEESDGSTVPPNWRTFLWFDAGVRDWRTAITFYPRGPQTLRRWYITAPYWFIVLVLAIWPTYWIARVRGQRNRAGLNLCATCGYDLRASRERCPECGTTIAAVKPAACLSHPLK
jgi:hypothetical protein